MAVSVVLIMYIIIFKWLFQWNKFCDSKTPIFPTVTSVVIVQASKKNKKETSVTIVVMMWD